MPENALAWHEAKMAGKNPPVHIDSPECGFFLMQGPKVNGEKQFIPASIFWTLHCDAEGNRISDDTLACEIGGVPADPQEAWNWLAKRPISFEEYQARMASLFMQPDY